MWLDSKNIEPKSKEVSQSKIELNNFKKEINSDQKTIQALSYLTTFARLPGNRDLDELFDGEVQLWEEELLSVYSLLEVVNWANTIWILKAPKKMYMDINWGQDYKYEVSYNIIPKNWKNVSQIQSLSWTWTLPLNDTKLKFNYNSENQIDSFDFERPWNLHDSWGWWVDQKIVLKRDKGLVNELSIMRNLELDNKLTITYNYLWKPELIEQTKLWALSDKMTFEYDESWNLKSIIYVPVLSLKHLKWFYNAWKQGNKFWWPLKAVKMAWEYVAFTALKKMKWVDVVEVISENWIIKSTKSNLDASEWVYKEGFSKNTYWDNWELNQVYLERDAIWPDDKKTLKIEY